MKRASYTSVFLVVLALFGSVGCWEEGESIDQAVWSDDDIGQAYTKLLFEEGPKATPLSQTRPRRNFRHQVFVQNADGSDRHAVTGVREHQSGGNLYHMRRAGYLVVDVFVGEREFRYDVIRLPSGEITPLVTHVASGEACASHEVIPSYDGEFIAAVERLSVRDIGRRCPTGEAVVTFYNSETLSTISSFRWPVTDMIQSAWNEAGEFIVVAPDDGAWRVDPATGPIPTEPPACLYPRSSSGNVSADGVVIGGGMSPNDPITVFPPFPEGNPYGCP